MPQLLIKAWTNTRNSAAKARGKAIYIKFQFFFILSFSAMGRVNN